MAELVGGAFLSSFLNVLIDRMASRRFLDFISGKKNYNEPLMRELKLKLLTANKLVDDAEEKQMTRPTVRTWLDDLKDAIYCVGELLEEINTEALRRQLEGDDEHSPAASSSTSWITRSLFKSSSPSDEFHNSLEPKISEVLRVLDLILKEKDVHDLKEGVQHRPQDRTRQTTSRVDDSGVFGREKDRETILKSLRSDDTTGAKIGVLPIVGMGGIGKSTLAQLVYKDVKDDFDVQAWVCVGEELDILQIVQTIYGRITDQTCRITDLDLLSERLEKVLIGKKFLFVLDDVWSEDYLLWENLMAAHFNSYGVHGSKIIVTTRLGGVASITRPLSTHYLQEISEDDSWSLFAKHAFTENSVIPAHPHLEAIGRQIVKKCQGLPLAIKSMGGLLHSVLNPKEWEKILKSDLWELPNDKVLPALWLSYQYLPPHLKRCFAYCAIFPKGYNFKASELILWWMAEDLLQPHGNEALEDVGSDYFDILVSRSFFQHSKDQYGQSCFTMHDLINDLAKFVSGEFCLRLEDDHLTVHRNICRVRHVSSMNFCNQSTQNLGALYEAKHLHGFLRLHSVHFIGLGNKPIDLLLVLPYLRVLKLQDRDIVELPSSIGDLKQLRHLDVSRTSITELPDKVCNLYNLQTLLLEACHRLIQLPSELGRLINLRHLNIRGTEFKQMLNCEKWLYYDGSRGNTTIMFPNLRELTLRKCPKLTEIVPLEKLPRLEKVTLCGLESFNGSLAHVGSECPKFLSLVHLGIHDCPNFVCFPDGGMDAPKLEELRISQCKKLRSLPEQMHTLLPSLQKLDIFGCPEVESFPQGGLASNIQDLSFQCCRKLAANRSLWGLTRLNSLRKLKINFTEEGGEEVGCSFPDEGQLPTTLTSLSILNHSNLTTIQGKVFTSLECLIIDRCYEC